MGGILVAEDEREQLAWELQVLRAQVNRRCDAESIVGRSAAMESVLQLVGLAASRPSPVLVTGESGVGKEVIARALHRQSDRASHIFLKVNCCAIPAAQLDSQLFGCVAGALGNQAGFVQRSRGGTIFLDEIGELPPALQAKLLRVLAAQEILPIGASTPIGADVRIIAATSCDLRGEVEAGRFDADLYDRLKVLEIAVPPLRERREDIAPLVEHLVRSHNLELKKSFKGVDSAALRLLISLPWKGNVRELDNVLEHAMIVGEPDWITLADLPGAVRQELPGAETPAPPTMRAPTDDLRGAVRSFERMHIEAVLQRAGNDKRAAARQLGVSLSSLYRKIDELGLPLQAEK